MHDKDRLGKVLKTAIAHDPKDADPHETMGIALLEEGKFDDAIKEFKRAIALDRKFSGYHLFQNKPQHVVTLRGFGREDHDPAHCFYCFLNLSLKPQDER